MTPEELHRAVIRAVAFGDAEGEHRLRLRFRGLDHDSAADYLHATAIVCLTYRLGATGPHGGINQLGEPVPLDHAALGRFMAELRAAGPSFGPRRNFLEVEAVIRGVYGETHLLEEVGPGQRREAFRLVLRYLADSVPEIREDFDAVIDKAQAIQKRWLVG